MKVVLEKPERMYLSRMIYAIALSQPEGSDGRTFWGSILQQLEPNREYASFRRGHVELLERVVSTAVDSIQKRLNEGSEADKIRAVTLDSYYQSIHTVLKNKLAETDSAINEKDDEDGTI